MKIFTAATMQEGMAQIKSELGRDAVILHTRRLKKGGVLGFFGKEVIEITAGVEATPQVATQATVPVPEVKMPPARPVLIDGDSKMTAVQLELGTMRKLLEQVLHKIPLQEEKKSPVFAMLEQNDIDEQIAAELVREAAKTKFPAGIHFTEDQAVLEVLRTYLQRSEGITVLPNATKTVAFIGPTGVGKTTTIAKLAANFAIKEGFKVALITADTYRISAVEQLKTYADIIGVPIEIVYTPDELKLAIQRHQDKQLILIDTAGRSPKNHYQLGELQALLEINPYIEVHLVLSMTTKYKEALDIVHSFSGCSPQKFLFTKLDEASNIGTMLNLLYQFPVTLSYVATGQNVPDDIELADPGKLMNLILKE
ncbi:flagellar biosynthesis protein FlhF [Propionispora hippei]|nr:flagellar biosynthesis protein FlhF [Propionispora hippei]